ncbi:MAG TPA: SEC59/DGK1/VTE5 family protein [Candidatus Nanoarchaeia archaeon]|nr:SEC59/DGK1/VTE5 family protein [Candidatus Nanoarchaeia archaeon]
MAKLMLFEFRRQLFHLFFGLLLIIPIQWGLLGIRELWILFMIGVALSIASMKYKIPVIHTLLNYFERHKHRKTFPGQGPIFYVLGAFLVMVLFEENIALAAIMILAFGDSISHLAGRFYGKIPHPLNSNKFLEGAVFGFIFAALGAWIFVPLKHALVGALIGMVAEGIDVKFGRTQIDDNLIIPLASASAIYLARIIGL